MRRAGFGAGLALAVLFGLALVLPRSAPARATTGSSAHTTATKQSTVARPSVPAQPGQGWLTGRRQRLLAVWLLVDVGGLLFWYGAEPVRAPKLLGAVGAHRLEPETVEPDIRPVRGIGRFARPRSGPPSRLL